MEKVFFVLILSLLILPIANCQPASVRENEKYPANLSASLKINVENLFDNPPDSAKPSCFWWWFNSLVDKPGITRDLEEFKKKGMGGAWIPPELNSRWFVQCELNLTGPKTFSGKLPVPDPRSGYKAPYYGNVAHYMTWPKEKMDYRISSVVAFRETKGTSLGIERLKLPINQIHHFSPPVS